MKKISLLGSGMVGRAHAAKLVGLGYDVMLGTQDVAKTHAQKRTDTTGIPAFSEWYKDNASVKLGTFVEAAAHGEIIYEALRGDMALGVLKKLESSLSGKIVVDIANPLDFSKGMPPLLFVCNTDSLGEQIQEALPGAHVVKTFNTMNSDVQVNPHGVQNADHHIFISGNDAEAKTSVVSLLKAYGWKNIMDLGDIKTARGTEMLLPIWLELHGILKTGLFNFKIIEA